MKKKCSTFETCVNFQEKQAPEMYIGKSWVLEQEGNPWHRFEVECVGKSSNGLKKYEQLYFRGRVESSCYPDANPFCAVGTFAIQCLDPKFWTGELYGEKVRCYEHSDGNISIIGIGVYYWTTGKSNPFTDKVYLEAMKNANIPIMPKEQVMEYEPPEE